MSARQWYYAQGYKRLGPVSEEEFNALVASREVTDKTLVWYEGMDEWLPYGTVREQENSTADTAGTAEAVKADVLEACSECGRSFPQDQLISLQGSPVCAECKPLALQKLQEGLTLSREWRYGGFWIRFAAKIIDNILLMIINQLATLPLGLLVGAQQETIFRVIMVVVNAVIAISISAGITTFFVGRFASTPGKMVCGLKIICADGSRVSYPRALGRYFAEILSGIILYIGYIMAAFDDEKRTLHDRICGTRVVFR